MSKLTLVIKLTLTRKDEMPLEWTYYDTKQARFFASLVERQGYHVQWTEIYEEQDNEMEAVQFDNRHSRSRSSLMN